MKKILSGAIISAVVIALVVLVFASSVSAQEITITAVREISPALADRGDVVDVKICFTAEENLAGVGITEEVPFGWNVTDISASPSAMSRFDINGSAVEFIWLNISAGTTVSATYKLHIPDYAVDGEYPISGMLKVADESIPIEGDNIVLVSSETDMELPVIHSVNLSKKEVTPGENIYVTAKVTDDVRVMSVSANEAKLSQQGDNWVGYIRAEAGTNVPVVVIAKDVAGKEAKDSSQKYNATGPAGTTPTSVPSGDGDGAVTTPTPAPTGAVNVTPSPSPEATATPAVSVTPTVTTSPSPTEAPTPTASATATPEKRWQIPGFEAVFAIASLLSVAYLVMRRRKAQS